MEVYHKPVLPSEEDKEWTVVIDENLRDIIRKHIEE